MKAISHNPLLERKVRRGYRRYCAAVTVLTFLFLNAMPAFVASDPLTVVNNLSDFIFGLIRAVGLILLGWGIVQVGVTVMFSSSQARVRMRWASVMISGPMPSPGDDGEVDATCFSHASTVIRAAGGR